MERASSALRPALTDRGRQCPDFDGKSMATGRSRYGRTWRRLAGTSDQLPAGHCGLRKRVRRAHEPTSPRAGYESFKVRERLGEQQRRPKGDRARHGAPGGACDQHVPAVLSLGRKQRGGRWDRLAKGRHRHSAIVVRSRRYRNARNGLLEDGAHVRYSEDFGSDGLRPRIPR